MGTIPILYLCRSFLSLLYILSWYSFTIGAVGATTTTFDDASSAFSFASTWNAITPSDPCNGCSTKLNEGDVVDGTWHDGSSSGSTASFTFDGTGVTLYGVTNGDQTCALTFALDGGSSVNLDLSNIPDTPTNSYNYPFFSTSGLSSGTHTLSWTIENSVNNAVALIDYAVVTSANPTTTTSSSVPSSTAGGSSTVTVTQAGGSSSTTSPTSSSSSSTTSSTATSSSSSSSSSPPSSGVTSFTTNTSTDSTSGSSSTPTTGSLTTAPASTSAVVITIGTSVITSMELSSTSTSVSTALQAAQKSKTATIVGAVLGSLLGLLLIGVMIFLLLRRRRRSLPPSATAGLEAFRYDPNLDTEAALGIYPREKATRSPPPSETSSSRPPSAPPPLSSPQPPHLPPLPPPPSPPSPPPASTTDESAFGPTSESEAFTETNNGTNNVSIAQPSASTEPLSATSAPIQQMEQRIQLLERMLRQADEADILLHDTSPPPYLAG